MSFYKSYSLNTKITLYFIVLGFILLSILYIQIIPNLQEDQKRYKKVRIENMITLTMEQLKLVLELFDQSSKLREEKIKTKLNNMIKDSNGIFLFNSNKKNSCELYSSKDISKILLDEELIKLKKKGLLLYKQKQNNMCPKAVKNIYYYKQLNKKEMIIKCSPKFFDKQHMILEYRIKENLQKSFRLTKEEHKGKINLIWINTKHKDYGTKPLYNKNDKMYNMKYCISKMSSSYIPQIGDLSAKQILDASNKEPLHYYLKNEQKYTYTWVRTLKEFPNKKLVFLMSIYADDYNKSFTSTLFKILPATILSLVIAILLGFFLFKRLFKSINILTNTAKQINKGNIDLRSNIKGNDDIAVLGKAFDNMLDSLEENIKNLDKKVDDKTKELSNSLEEKEVLLKEIHHRVKNNLAMTINLIKLQKSKIKDNKTKEILVDIQERIFTMELLHRKLYESKDISSIPFKKYVEELCSDLYETYSNFRDIKIFYEIDDINMSIEYALPCGIIITEALTNSFKYAFDSSMGEIYVKFKMKDKKCFLIIQDNGVGLSENINLKKIKTLGLKLIFSIVKGQLLGKIDYENKDKSTFKISFCID